MNTQRSSRTTATDPAREFIDDIAKINRDFGMGTVASEKIYNEAVTNAASAFQWVKPGRGGQRAH